MLLFVVGCSCLLLCVVACYRGLIVAVCLGIHGCMLVGGGGAIVT